MPLSSPIAPAAAGWSIRSAVVLVTVVVAAALAACRDDGGADDMSDAGTTTVTGCEIGDTSAARAPVPAPAAPDGPEAVATFLEEAIAATRSLSSAVVTQGSTLDAPGAGTGVEIRSVFADDGTGRVAAEVWAAEEDVAVVACSDGSTAWLHVDHPAAAAELPSGVAWVTASREELVRTELMVGLDETWLALPVLRGMDGEAVETGTGEVADSPVQLLRGPVDYDAVLDSASSDEAEALSRLLATGADEVDVEAEVGVDGDGIVRLLVVDLSAEGGMTVSYRLEVEEVDPEVPTPDAPAEEGTVPLVNVPDLLDVLSDR